jgi:peptidoglycan/LPS O-acetylase OafA/YrhL
MPLFNPIGWFAVCALCVLLGGAIARTSPFYRARLDESAAGRYETLDGLRGFLAYAVLASHAVSMHAFHTTGAWTDAASPLYARAAQAGVALFFAITGFLFWLRVLRSGERLDTRALYLSRLRRLAPMYLLSVAMVFIVAGCLTHFVPQVSLASLARDVRAWLSFGFLETTTLNGVADAHVINAVYWTLAFEWSFYIALPFLAVFSRGTRSALLFSAAVFFGMQEPIVLNFLFGALAALLVQRGTLKGRLGSRWLAPLPIAGLVGCLAMPYPQLQPVLLFVFFVFVVHGFDLFGLLRTRAAKVLGAASYSLYLTHCIVLFVVLHAADSFVPLGSLAPLEFWLLVALSAALTVMLSALTFRYVEYPFINPQAAPLPSLAPARMQSA